MCLTRRNWYIVFIPLVLIPMYLVTFFGVKPAGIPFLYTNVTASLPVGWYIAIPGDTIRLGDFVAYDEPEIIAYAKDRGWLKGREQMPQVLLKKAAPAGTPYSLTPDGSFYVNYKYIGKILRTNRDGQSLPQMPPGNYVVPDGMFLPYTHQAGSFDGRYTGPVSINKIRHRVVPVLTF